LEKGSVCGFDQHLKLSHFEQTSLSACHSLRPTDSAVAYCPVGVPEVVK